MKRFHSWSFLLVVAMLVSMFSSPVAHAAPARPTGLTAVSLGSSSIQLTWDDSGADYYRVYYGTSSSGMALYGQRGAANCTVTFLRCNTKYYFRVRAFLSGASSPFSLTVNARTTVGITAPSYLGASAVSSSQIDLGWPAVPGAVGYVLYQANSSSGPYWAFVATPYTNHSDRVGLAGNTRRYYKVRAYNSAGEGNFSAKASARTFPPAVTGLHADALPAGGVRLNWNAASGASRYKILCSTTSTGTYVQVGETSSRNFTFTSLTSNSSFCFKVRAANSLGESPDSDYVQVHTLPAVPTGLHAEPRTISKILLTWPSVEGAAKYAIYRASSSNGHYSYIGFTFGTTFTSTGLKVGKRYYFRVSAINAGGGETTKSAKVSCKTYSITGTPHKPDFKLINYTLDGAFFRAAFGHAATPNYPSTMEPVFKFYYGTSESSMKAHLRGLKTAESVFGGDRFTMNVLPGTAMWYGFRAYFGSKSGPMQMFKIAAIRRPTGLIAGPAGGAGVDVVEFGWNIIPEASRFNVYVSTVAPDSLRSWADNKGALSSAHKLSYKGNTNDTLYYITNVPNHSTLYYIVVPANSAGVEGWFFNSIVFTFDY